MKTTNLYESLFIFHKCQISIHHLWHLIHKLDDNDEDNSTGHLLSYQIILEAVSFIEEYNGGFITKVEPEYLERVKDVRKINSPIMKRISYWKDLEKFRNNIIAHPWRHKGKFVFPSGSSYHIPHNWFDFTVFVNLLKYMWSMINVEFSKELNKAIEYVDSLKTPPVPPDDYSKLNADHLEMAKEVHKFCKELGKPYHLKVMNYVLPKDGDLKFR